MGWCVICDCAVFVEERVLTRSIPFGFVPLVSYLWFSNTHDSDSSSMRLPSDTSPSRCKVPPE